MVKRRILDAFNIEEKEVGSVSILLTHSLFLGFFYGALDISAHTLFLQEFEETFIAKAYTISGVAGIIMTFIYSKFQQRISFNFLSVSSVIVLSIITLGLWLSYAQLGISKELIFITFILLGPLNIVAIVNFWGIVGRLFSLRQGKRLFGLIGSGQIFGTIIISYFIPLISVLKLNIKTYDLILIAAVNLFLAAIAQLVLVKFEKPQEQKAGTGKNEKSKSGGSLFLKDRYIMNMTVYVALSMIVLFFVAYTFLAAAQSQYPEEQEMKSFLGIFTGTMMIFGFILKTFIYSKLMKTYGLKVTLLILPILLLILSFVIIFVFHSSISTFIIVFLLLSMSRLFSMSIRDAIEIPAFKTLYQSLAPNIRHEIQAKIDGTVNELAALAAGLILTLLGFFFDLINYIYFLVGFIALWIYSGIKLYKNYKISLQDTLSNFEQSESEKLDKSAIDKKLDSERKYLEISNPLLYEQQTIGKIRNSSIDKTIELLPEIERNLIFIGIDPLEKLLNSIQNKKQAARISQTTYLLSTQLPTSHSLEELSNILKSGNIKSIIKVAKFLRFKPNNLYSPLILQLLRELNKDIKREALISSAHYPQDEIIRLLIEELQNIENRILAENSIREIGYKAVPFLIGSFQKNIDKPDRLESITSLISEISAVDSTNFLISNFNFYHRNIAVKIVSAINILDVKIPEIKFREFQQAVEQKAQLYAWNVEALNKAQSYPDYLKSALKTEIDRAFDELFELLAAKYETNSITQIKRNIETGSSEEIGFAIELMDLFIDEELKPILFPLLDNIPVEEKILALSEFFTISIMDNPLIISLLGRGANYLSRWTILCALIAVNETDEEISNNEILAHVYNPNKVLRNTALIISHKKNKDNFNKIMARFNFQEKTEIEKLIEEAYTFPLSIRFNLTLFLKKLFINFTFTESQLIRWIEQADYKVQHEYIELNYNRYDKQLYILLIKGRISFYNEFTKISELNKTGSGMIFKLSDKHTLKLEIEAYSEFLLFKDKAINYLSAKDKNFFELINMSEN